MPVHRIEIFVSGVHADASDVLLMLKVCEELLFYLS
jgi:hypothetical protein